MTSRKLAKREFDILAAIAQSEKRLSQRGLAKATGVSLGTVNKTIADLTERGLIKDRMITVAGIDALEPYRVKRAVLLAAGFGSRLVPITLNTPKPLIRVHDKRIIETLLDAIVAAGIEEIYVVRGYLAEQFDILLKRYPQIRFLENFAYNETNNISSMECARFLLANAYVLESDFFLSNPKLITKYQYQSNYLGIPVDITDDWCFVTKGDVIEEVNIGGTSCYEMVGISYWTEEDGNRLAKHIDDVYRAPGGKERYWDLVPLTYHKDSYEVHIRPCSAEDIVEIDTFNELKAIDKTYAM